MPGERQFAGRLRGGAAWIRLIAGEPIELIGTDVRGGISARRGGEPSFTGVSGTGDAIMAAITRGVDLIVPAHVADEVLDDLPLDSLPCIPVR